MMISQPALICLNATWQRLMRRSVREVEPAALEQPCNGQPWRKRSRAKSRAAAEASLVAAGAGEAKSRTRGARTAAGAPHAVDVSAPLAANERRARAAALRAMALSRERRFDAAGRAFTEAAGLDPALDLTRTPAFWKLERAAHEAAIDAYRRRDVSAMRRFCARGCKARFARSRFGRDRRPSSARSDYSSNQMLTVAAPRRRSSGLTG